MAQRRKFVSRPDHVTCVHTTYHIKWMEDEEWRATGHDGDERGDTHHVTCEIHVRLGVGDERFSDQMLREVLTHECLHVVSAHSFLWNAWENLRESDREEWNTVEEIIVGAWSIPTLMLLKENPGLLAYLLDDKDHE